MPAMSQTPLEHGFVHVLQHFIFGAPVAVLVAPSRARSAAGCASAASARSSTWRPPRSSSASSGILLAFSPDVLAHFYEVREDSTRWA